MTLEILYNKIKQLLINNKESEVLISTKNKSILNQDNNFKDANRIKNLKILDVKAEDNKIMISHKENLVSLSRDNEYVFLKWRCDEYSRIRSKLLQLLNDDSFSKIQKDKLRNILVEKKFNYSDYVDLEQN